MKQLGIASFTENGGRIADTLIATFGREYEIARYEKGLKDWCGGLFAAHADGIIFVGACGIAVRTIAPFLKSKTTDPAVLVIDERGQFVISLLSGHIGGANRLAIRAAEVLKATPVITTATDVNGKFAVDVFASDNHLRIGSMAVAKEISAAILRGGNVGVYCEGGIQGKLPSGLILVGTAARPGQDTDWKEQQPGLDNAGREHTDGSRAIGGQENTQVIDRADGREGNIPIDALICIGVPSGSFRFMEACGKTPGLKESEERRSSFSDSAVSANREIAVWASKRTPPILCLFPKAYILGVGCKKGKPETAIARAVDQAMRILGISPEDIAGVASIDLKKDEPGLVEFCRNRNLCFQTFSAQTLAKVQGDFTGSSFVQSVTGVDNVCERAALCLASQISEKTAPTAVLDSEQGGYAGNVDADCSSACKENSGIAIRAAEGRKTSFRKEPPLERARLILGKQVVDGVTVAVAERKWSVRF